jgi:tight adherence protein B
MTWPLLAAAVLLAALAAGSDVRPRQARGGGRPGHLGAAGPLAEAAGPLRAEGRPEAAAAQELRWRTGLPLPGRAARRRQELEAAVPEVLDVLRATVTAGAAPLRALQAAAEVASPPLAGLLAEALRVAELGSGTGVALAGVARRERLTELLLAGEALDLAETTGAPPGQVLAGVAAAAAERVRARQARLAATAEARLSARVVAGMAPAFLLVLAVTSPSDAAFLVREPLGWATLAAAAVFESLGVWWAARIVGGTP